MNKLDQLPTGFTRRESLLAMLGAAAALAGCGGGGDDTAGVGLGGTGAFSVGPITGIGSIIVNGIRYDDSSASIGNDDSPFRRGGFRLGMVVAVQGSPVVNGRSTASRIVLTSELVGPVASVGTSSFEVLGQTVEVDSSTAFDPSFSSGLGSITVNTVVEVHGVAGSTANSIRATYIERKSSNSEYKLQGVVTAHNATSRTFSIGSLNMDYSTTPADRIRVTPAVGALIRVRLQSGPASTAVWTVTRIRRPEDDYSGFSGEVEFKGTITSFTSLSSFVVNDVPVDASQALFREGTIGIAAGAFVEVEGRLVNGVFVATSVKPDDDGAGAVGGGTEFELHGTVSGATTSGSGGSFTLTSSGGVVVAVDWLNGIEFRDGAAASLTNGRRVEVKGSLTSGGTRVNATRISFES